jgi:hypothetical protein
MGHVAEATSGQKTIAICDHIDPNLQGMLKTA